MLKRRTAQGGFTLVEIMISLTVLAILISLGAPSFGEWLQSQKIRAAAESILNGMQVARGEAIRRNLAVQLVLAPPTSAWTTCEATIQPCDSTLLANPVTAVNVIQNRAHEEGTSNAVVATTPQPAIAVTFSPLGSVVANFNGSPALTQVDVSSAAGTCVAAGGAMRCLRVVVTGGGNVRMCDPTPTVVAPDPRVCP
jgi:type IV fimbrial biogenesis protein FimT